MSQNIEASITKALAAIQNQRLENDVISAGMIRDLQVSQAGEVSLKFLLGRDDPATMVRQVRKAIKAVDGVTQVQIDVQDSGGDPQPLPAAAVVPFLTHDMPICKKRPSSRRKAFMARSGVTPPH